MVLRNVYIYTMGKGKGGVLMSFFQRYLKQPGKYGVFSQVGNITGIYSPEHYFLLNMNTKWDRNQNSTELLNRLNSC